MKIHPDSMFHTLTFTPESEAEQFQLEALYKDLKRFTDSDMQRPIADKPSLTINYRSLEDET